MSDTRRTVTLECKQCGSRYEESARKAGNPYLLKVKEQYGVAHLCRRCSDRVFIRRWASRWPLCPFETIPEWTF